MAIEIGSEAPDFELQNQSGNKTKLSDLVKKGPVLLVFYPGDFTAVCTKQLCNYRDNLDSFSKYGVQVIGISANSIDEHERFVKEYGFSFDLLTDADKTTAKQYGATSLLMLGGIGRAVYIVGKDRRLLYRYIEPTALTRRKADELIEVIQGLKAKGQV